MDEADRMFGETILCTYLSPYSNDALVIDMGFEPQISRILSNIRPDRQCVLFSATFPQQVERLARKELKKPVEITVGGRSVVSDTIEHFVEVRKEDEKFFRLLEILGEWYEKVLKPDLCLFLQLETHPLVSGKYPDICQ